MASLSASLSRETRRFLVFGAFLLAAGLAAGVLWGDRFRGAVSAITASREERLRGDACALLALVRPDPRLPESLEGQDAFWKVWEDRRASYTAEERRDLAGRLHAYLDFLEAEYADCADIYAEGHRETHLSDAAKAARERLAPAFGDLATTILAQADELRDEAYRASPRHSGFDPHEVNFVTLREGLRTWMPRARARVAELALLPEDGADAPR